MPELMSREMIVDGCTCEHCEYSRAHYAALDAVESLSTETTVSEDTTTTDDDTQETQECERCGDDTPIDELHTIERAWRASQQWCDDCCDNYSAVCNECDERHDVDTMHRIRVSHSRRPLWCDSCSDNSAVCNDDTGERATESYAYDNWHFWDSDDCWHSSPERTRSIHDYGCNVINEHGWPRETDSASLCFGVELEMECIDDRDDVSDSLGGRDGDGRFILKEDGSLENGIELVTLPYTLEYHTKQFDWRALLAPLHGHARSGSGTTRCGIHIHANRRALTPLQIGKTLVFLNCEENASFITHIAQRRSNGYCERDSRKKVKDGKRRGCNRYDLLNVSPRDTIEFRLFRGNLRAERVLKNIEFCHALLTYCATASMREVENYRPFIAWLAKRTSIYPNLIKYLRDEGRYLTQRVIPSQYATQSTVVDA